MAQMEMVRQLKRREDGVENIVLQIIQRAYETRRKTIQLLKNYAVTADRIHQGCAASNRNASITGASGGVFGVLAGGLVVLTAGAAAPIVIGGLTGVGAICSVGGGAWSVKNEYDRGQRNTELKKKILQQLAEDDEALSDMNDVFYRIEKGDFGEPSCIFRELHIFFCAIGSIGMTYGSTAAIEVLRLALPPLAFFLAGGTSAVLFSMIQYLPLIAGHGAIKGAEEVAEQCASSAVKTMCDGFSKDFVRREALKAAQKAYKEILEEVIETTTTEVAKKTAQQGAKEAAAKAAKEAASKAAQKAAQEGIKTAAKVTGTITAGFGAFTCAWEGYNAYQNHHASQEESQLGRELRNLAKSMEESLGNIH